jgi:thioester reductase-like protein
MTSSYSFLTGGTGLLGRFLIRDLLMRGARLALLVRGSKRESAQERMEAICQHWEQELGHNLPRPVMIEGDLRESELGLTRDSKRWVARHCDQMIHSAASLSFHADSDGEPWRTNYDGTRHMLDLCRATKIRRLHYVSTAYVCGLREGTILESDLDRNQKFRNVYEESKFRAERLVRSAEGVDQLTVYRPAVIAGDSQTGYTNTYHGIYLYLRLMALVVPRQPVGPDGKRMTRLRLPMTGDERRNVIPVDWASQAMSHLILSRESHGNTFHLAPDQCVTPRQIIEAAYRYFQSSGVEYVGYQKIDPETYNDFEREFLPGVTMYNDYEATDPLFDCSNLKRFAGHLPCPVIDEPMLHRFLRFGEEDRWGKRRAKKTAFDSTVIDMLQSLLQPTEKDDVSRCPRVSLNLLGPGGSQWTVVVGPSGDLSAVPGLDESAMFHGKMSTNDLIHEMARHRDEFDLESSFRRWILSLCGRESTGNARQFTRSSTTLPIQG